MYFQSYGPLSYGSLFSGQHPVRQMGFLSNRKYFRLSGFQNNGPLEQWAVLHMVMWVVQWLALVCLQLLAVVCDTKIGLGPT